MWNIDSLHAGLHGISFPSIVSLFTSTLCAFASFYLSVVTWSQSLQCRRGDSDGCGSLTPTPLCNIRWEKKNKKDSWLACSGNAQRNALLWLLYLHACLLKQEVPKLFQSVIPLSITVELQEDPVLEFKAAEDPGQVMGLIWRRHRAEAVTAPCGGRLFQAVSF